MEYGMGMFVLIIAAFVLLAMSKNLFQTSEGQNKSISFSEDHIAFGVVGILGLFSLFLMLAGIGIHQLPATLGGLVNVSLSIGFYLVMLATVFTFASIFAFHVVDQTSNQLKEATEKAAKTLEATDKNNTVPPTETLAQETQIKTTEEVKEVVNPTHEEIKNEIKPTKKSRTSTKKNKESSDE